MFGVWPSLKRVGSLSVQGWAVETTPGFNQPF